MDVVCTLPVEEAKLELLRLLLRSAAAKSDINFLGFDANSSVSVATFSDILEDEMEEDWGEVDPNIEVEECGEYLLISFWYVSMDSFMASI